MAASGVSRSILTTQMTTKYEPYGEINGTRQGCYCLTMTPALACAPMSQVSKTEKRREVAIPPRSRPSMRTQKLLKSAGAKRAGQG